MDTIRCCFSCCCCPLSIAMIGKMGKGLLESRGSVAFYMPTTCFCLCIPPKVLGVFSLSLAAKPRRFIARLVSFCGSWCQSGYSYAVMYIARLLIISSDGHYQLLVMHLKRRNQAETQIGMIRPIGLDILISCRSKLDG